MTKLSDTQSIILSAAAQRSDANVLPLPGSLRGGAAGKVVNAMLTRGLVREQVTEILTEADAALNTIWRNEADGRAVLLRITPAGLEAIGVEREGGRTTRAPTPPTRGRRASSPPQGPRAPPRRLSARRRTATPPRGRRPRRRAQRLLRARPARAASRRCW